MQIFRLRNKRTTIVKISFYIIGLYSMYVLLQITVSLYQRRSSELPSKDSVRVLEMGKLSVQFNWLSSRGTGTEKKQQNYFDNNQEDEKSKLDHSRLLRREDIEIFIDGNTGDRKSSYRPTSNETNSDKNEPSIGNDIKLSEELANTVPGIRKHYPVKENIKQQKELISSKRKYIFTLRYYEQLAGATKNLIDLASLAKHFNRDVVMPFINNSRMSGIQDKIQLGSNRPIFNSLSRYFDITHFNATLSERGYAPLAHFSDFIEDCKHGLDVLAHFIYNDSFALKDARNWFGLASKSWIDLRKKMPKNGGVQTCNFLRKSGIERLLGGVTVKEYVCVDPEIIRTADQIESDVFKKQGCIGILQWKGMGNKRTHFSLPESVFQILKPSDVVHNHTLMNIAKDFVRRHIQTPFLAVHIRAERQLVWYGLNRVMKCINTLSKKVFHRIKAFQIGNVYLSTDLPIYGSDTYKSAVSRERTVVQRYVKQSLRKPKMFNPELYGIYDKGEISIIEMNILSLGESIYTLGGGKFQQWVVELFLAHNTEDHSLVHRFCLEKLS